MNKYFARLFVISIAIAIASAAYVVAQQPGPTGTGRISGTVVADDAQKTPLGGAIVTISGGGLTRARSTVTTVTGSFSFTSLPAGWFGLTASKPAYVTMAYGAKRPERPGTLLAVAAAQNVRDVVIRLPRGAVIKGTLRDQNGEPVPGVTVNAIKPGTARVSATNVPSAMTDDRGAYRIFGLASGDYFVAATFRLTGSGGLGAPTSSEIDRALAALQRVGSPGAPQPLGPVSTPAPSAVYALAPTFFPGTSNSSLAERLTLASGEERTADFVVAPVRAGSIEGVVQTADGSPIPPIVSSLVSEGPTLPFTGGDLLSPSVRPRASDGRFKFTGVTPGRYVLTMRGAGTDPATGRGGGIIGNGSLWAMASVTTDGNDVTGLSLTLRPALHFSGRVAFDGTSSPPDPSVLRIDLAAPRGIGVSFFNSTLPPTLTGVVRADATFDVLALLPSSYAVTATAPSGWWLRSAVVNGIDVLDSVLDFATSDIGGAVLTFTDRHSEISGTLQTAANAPATDYSVVVFSSDRTHWRPGARRVQSTRPATDGHFAIRDLPAGDYYIAALTDVAPEDLGDPVFLAALVPGAVKVTLADGEKKTQNLRIAR